MNSIIYTFLMTVLWVLNLFNDTGLGQAYHTTEYTKVLIILLAVIVILSNYSQKNGLKVSVKELVGYILLFLVFCLSSFVNGYGLDCLNYLWVYTVVYVIGQLPVNDKCIRLTSISYGFLGIVILAIYNYGSFLNGWNPNTIAMIGLHSFLIYLIPFYRNKKILDRLLLIAVATIYSILIFPTDSRSGILFAFIAIGFIFISSPEKITIRNKRVIWSWLLVPLCIAIFTILISHMPIANQLNNWSLEYFRKPMFNGRDVSWNNGINLLSHNLLFGIGFINGGYYHNSAMTCLTAFGVVGFLLWLNSISYIINKGRKWASDYIVIGSVISFFILYTQQSLELGLFMEDPILFPYIILGILLGRVKYLKRIQYE